MNGDYSNYLSSSLWDQETFNFAAEPTLVDSEYSYLSNDATGPVPTAQQADLDTLSYGTGPLPVQGSDAIELPLEDLFPGNGEWPPLPDIPLCQGIVAEGTPQIAPNPPPFAHNDNLPHDQETHEGTTTPTQIHPPINHVSPTPRWDITVTGPQPNPKTSIKWGVLSINITANNLVNLTHYLGHLIQNMPKPVGDVNIQLEFLSRRGWAVTPREAFEFGEKLAWLTQQVNQAQEVAVGNISPEGFSLSFYRWESDGQGVLVFSLCVGYKSEVRQGDGMMADNGWLDDKGAIIAIDWLPECNDCMGHLWGTKGLDPGYYEHRRVFESSLASLPRSTQLVRLESIEGFTFKFVATLGSLPGLMMIDACCREGLSSDGRATELVRKVAYCRMEERLFPSLRRVVVDDLHVRLPLPTKEWLMMMRNLPDLRSFLAARTMLHVEASKVEFEGRRVPWGELVGLMRGDGNGVPEVEVKVVGPVRFSIDQEAFESVHLKRLDAVDVRVWALWCLKHEPSRRLSMNEDLVMVV